MDEWNTREPGLGSGQPLPGSKPEIPGQRPNIAGEAKEEARRVTSKARDRMMHMAELRKDGLCDDLDELASRLEDMSTGPDVEASRIDGVVAYAADAVRRLSGIVGSSSVDELIGKVQGQLRTNPGMLIAGFAALGFLGGRLLRE